jgi:hypothetical protein
MEAGIVAEFADVAHRYCDWVEASPNPKDIMIVHRLLAELQLKALLLPDIWGEDEYVEVENKRDNWEAIRDRLHGLPVDGYWKVFDVFVDSEEPVLCTLPDDLGDIYADLNEGLHFYLKGNEDEAVWRWRFAYFTHWGRHLSGAQTALHQYFADQGGELQTLSDQNSS